MRDYTTEDISEMHDRNENFCGTQANIAKIRLYNEIKGALRRGEVGGWLCSECKREARHALDRIEICRNSG